MGLTFTASTRANFPAMSTTIASGRRVACGCRVAINTLSQSGILVNFGTTAGGDIGVSIEYISDTATTGHLRVIRKTVSGSDQIDQSTGAIGSAHAGQEIWVGYRDEGLTIVGALQLWVRMPGDPVATSISSFSFSASPYVALDGTIQIGNNTGQTQQLLGRVGDVFIFDGGTGSVFNLAGSAAMMQQLSQGVLPDNIPAAHLLADDNVAAVLRADMPLIGGQGYDRVNTAAAMTLTGVPTAIWMQHAPHAADWGDYPPALWAKTRVLFFGAGGVSGSFRSNPPQLAGSYPTQTSPEIRDRSGNSYHGANGRQPITGGTGTRPMADDDGLHFDYISAPIDSQANKLFVYNDSSGADTVPAAQRLTDKSLGLGVVYAVRSQYAGLHHHLIGASNGVNGPTSLRIQASGTATLGGLHRFEVHGGANGSQNYTAPKASSSGWDALLMRVGGTSAVTMRSRHGDQTGTGFNFAATDSTLRFGPDSGGVIDTVTTSYAAGVVTSVLTDSEADLLFAWLRARKALAATYSGTIMHVGSSTPRGANAPGNRHTLRLMARALDTLKMGFGSGGSRSFLQWVDLSTGYTGLFPLDETVTETATGRTCVVAYFNPVTRRLYTHTHAPNGGLTTGNAITSATSGGTITGTVGVFESVFPALMGSNYSTIIAEMLNAANNRLPAGPTAVVIANLADYLNGASPADMVSMALAFKRKIISMSGRVDLRWYIQEPSAVSAAFDFVTATIESRAAVARGEFTGSIRVGSDPQLDDTADASVQPVYSGDGTHLRTGYLNVARLFDDVFGPIFDGAFPFRRRRRRRIDP